MEKATAVEIKMVLINTTRLYSLMVEHLTFHERTPVQFRLELPKIIVGEPVSLPGRVAKFYAPVVE